MKRKKLRLITLMIIGVLGIASITGCNNKNNNDNTKEGKIENFNEAGYPVVNEKITINAFTSINPQATDFNTMNILSEIDEKTNVDVVYECVTQNLVGEKKNLLLATNDLPDIFFGGAISMPDIEKYKAQGMFIPLDDLIEKYAPNIKKMFEENPDIKKACTASDGNLYTLPYVEGNEAENIPTYIMINKKWLDKLGLSIPKTTDEFYEILKAFKTQDPNGNGKNDEIPFSYTSDAMWVGDLGLSGAFGIPDHHNRILLKVDKITFTSNTDEYKEYLKWIKKLYSEGLIDQEIFTHDGSTFRAKLDENIMGVTMAYGPGDLAKKYIDDFITIEPLVGPKGYQSWTRFSNVIYPGRFLITNLNKYPEASIRWVDTFYDKEISIQLRKGSFSEKLVEKKEDGKYYVSDETEKVVMWEKIPAGYAPGRIAPETYKNEVIDTEIWRKIASNYNMYDKFAIKEPIPRLSLTSEESSELSTLQTDLLNYVKEMKGKFITGAIDIDKEWSNYVSQLERMGLNKYLDIYNGAYKRYTCQ